VLGDASFSTKEDNYAVVDTPLTEKRPRPRRTISTQRSLYSPPVGLRRLFAGRSRQSLGAGLTVLTCAAIAFLVGVSPGPTSDPDGPNVVVILTDDQTVESLAVMPRTRAAVGGQGVTFERSYVSHPSCCPSRATYMTGRHAHGHGVYSSVPPNGGYYRLDGDNTLPVWLEDAGYETIHVGKYLNGYGTRDPREVPPGWTQWATSVDPSTASYWGYTLNEDGRLRRYGLTTREDPALYQTDVYRRKAIEAIRARAARKRPFFLSVDFFAPHAEALEAAEGNEAGGISPARSAPRHRGRFEEAALPRSPAFDERDVSDKPVWIRGRPRLNKAAVRRAEANHRGRLESLLAVDEAVAAIVDTLRRTGELDKTYIIFTSDNGLLEGQHRVAYGKYLPYEASTRVPLLIRGPGLPRGRRSEELVSNIDLAPTILDALDVRAGARVDGRSLLRSPGVLECSPVGRSCTNREPPRQGHGPTRGRAPCRGARSGHHATCTSATSRASRSCTTSARTPISSARSMPTPATRQPAKPSPACSPSTPAAEAGGAAPELLRCRTRADA
jgi:N-acetylglucosamine-6-sulfatase